MSSQVDKTDKVERLRERAVAVRLAADEMVLSYGEIITEREALRERVRELEEQRPTFCSHIAVPWNGHHEDSCYTRPPADPAPKTAMTNCWECGKTREGHDSDERAALTGLAWHPFTEAKR